MNKVTLLLHLYQPPVQEEKILREVAENSYLPIIKLLKNKTKFKLVLSAPLSLLEQMEKYGYTDWIKDIKFLSEEGRLEIVGGAAYHPLLTKVPDPVKQNQIILNEYALGFYFGRRTGFEGEEAILVKDLNGFFAPELAVDEDLNLFLSEFGYEWMVVDPASVEGASSSDSNVYVLEDSDCLIVTRDESQSNNLAFFRGLNVKPLLNSLMKKDDLVLALDGETFGHHNEDGIYLLTKFIDRVSKSGKEFVTMSEFVDDKYFESQIEVTDKLKESTWASYDSKDPYYLWEGNEIQDKLYDIYNAFLQKLSDINGDNYRQYKGLENKAIWNEDNLPEEILLELKLNQVLGSDVFWWVSGEKIGETKLYNPGLVKNFLDMYFKVAELTEDPDLIELVKEKSEEISSLL